MPITFGMDPKKFATLSQFALGAGQGMFQAGRTPGVGPLAGILAGVGGGGQQVTAHQNTEVKRALLGLQQKQAQQNLDKQQRNIAAGKKYAAGLADDDPGKPLLMDGYLSEGIAASREWRLSKGTKAGYGSGTLIQLNEDFGGFEAGKSFTARLNPGGFYEATRRDGSTVQIPSTIVTKMRLEGDETGLGLSKSDISGSLGVQAGAAADIASASVLRERMIAAGPGSAGFRILISKPIAGYLGQFSEKLGDWASKKITGVNSGEATAIRIEGQAVVTGLIEPFTGEGSKRVTKTELEIAETTSRIAKDPSASLPEVSAALGVAMKLNLKVMDREALLRGEDGIFDLDSRDGLNAAGDILMNTLNMTKKEAVDVVKSLQVQRAMQGLGR